MSAVVQFPRPMKRGPKVKRGPMATVANFPARAMRDAAYSRALASMTAANGDRAKLAAALDRLQDDCARMKARGLTW